jgi:hypothetical protein
MANKQISYTTRDFQNIRQELVNFVNAYYPELIQNVNDAAVFSVFLDLNAAVTDNLHYHIDRSIQETVLQYAQQSSSLYNIARTYGLKIPGQRPSVALVDFSIVVPANGDKEDLNYCGILRRGSQVYGAGQVFEVANDVNFGDERNSEGFRNRTKTPIKNANGTTINYRITKREPVVNGITKVFRKTITTSESRPFLELFLPEKNVLGVTSVLLKDGLSYNNVPSVEEFLGLNNRWYEVDALAQDRIFVEDPTIPQDEAGKKVGKYIQTSDKFITEYTPQGFLKMTFGGGSQSTDELLREFARNGTPLDLSKYSNNLSLGSTITPNTTLFVQYRIGGGLGTNLGTGVINQIGTINFAVTGPNQSINNSVINSMSCTNVTAAIGGANVPTIEEVRNLIGFNFSSQNRAVTINDYNSVIRKMPSQYGAPAKVAITEEDNKIKVKMLSYDNQGKLQSNISSSLKTSVSNYLSNYRMINDYISVESAEVIDLKLEISVVLDSTQNQGTVITNIVNTVDTFFSPLNRNMGENVYISELKRLIQSLNGVLSINGINVFNLVGGQYSSNQTSQPYSDNTTKQISLINDTLFATPSQIYQIRFPSKDITVSTLNSRTVNFS